MAQCKFIEDVGMMLPKESSPKKYRYFLVECPYCGGRFNTQARNFKKGMVKSCKKCSSGIRDKSIYHRKHGKRRHPLYQVWAGMKTRCNDSSSAAYKNYGERGISVCQSWSKDFLVFYEWAIENGYKKGLEIDRIDNDGDYSPNNCRFVSKTKNLMNQRPIRRNNSTGYTGVFHYGKTGRFYAKIYHEGKPINLGVFDTKEEASEAYQRARREKSKLIDEREG